MHGGTRTMLAAAHFFPGKEHVRVLWRNELQAAAIVTGTENPSPVGLRLVKTRGKWYVEQSESCNNQVTVPDVIGLSEANAKRMLQAAGLRMVEWGEPTGNEPGVTSQDPAAGANVEPGSVVKVSVLQRAGEEPSLQLTCPPGETDGALAEPLNEFPTMLGAAYSFPGVEKLRVLWRKGGVARVIAVRTEAPSPALLTLVSSDRDWYVKEFAFCST
jgi:hypothetical protein